MMDVNNNSMSWMVKPDGAELMRKDEYEEVCEEGE